MQALASVSPLKRKQEIADARTVKPRSLQSLGVQGWPCVNFTGCPDGLLKVVEKKNGGQFVTCDHDDWQDPTSCKLTLSILKPSKDRPHSCTLCLQDVGGKPSLGSSTGEKDSRGYAVWDNIHGVFAHCAGAKTSDGSKFKNATTAGVEHIDKECLCSDASASPATDIKAGCTGKVVSGDLVLKDWENPPLHLVCAKRVWQKTVEEILEAKKQYKDLGTTADKEASQPSASVPSDLEDF